MFRAVLKEWKKSEWKKSDTNSKPLLEMTWEETLCLENIERTNKYAKFMNMMVSWTRIKIVCLVSQSTMTKIVSNLENNRSFSMKSIEMEFYGYSVMGSCLRDL